MRKKEPGGPTPVAIARLPGRKEGGRKKGGNGSIS